jgi:type I restriction enzyme S subunit
MNIKQGYKQTEIGIIPEDWEVNSLIKVLSKIIDNRGKTPPYSKDSGIELIESASISFVNQYPDYSKVNKFVSKSTYDFWFRGHPVKHDILISTVGEYSGSTAIINENRGTIAQNLIALRINELNPNYVFYWTKSNSFKKQLDQVMMNQAQPSLRVPWLLNFQLIYPLKLQEQTAIATALSDIDALIGELDKLIAKKQGIKQATMQQLLTGKKRLAGFSGEWEVKRLGELLDYEQPTKYLVSSTEYNDHNNVAVLTAGKSFVLGYTNEEHGIFQNLPVIIFDDFTTTTKYVDFPFKVKSSAMKMLKPKNEQVNLKFLFEKIQTIRFLLNDHKRYWISEYQKLEIELPSIEEQNAIANILSDMDAEISQLEGRRAKMGELKQGMMQELLTGRIRLNTQDSTRC